jgi:hypothetical protein
MYDPIPLIVGLSRDSRLPASFGLVAQQRPPCDLRGSAHRGPGDNDVVHRIIIPESATAASKKGAFLGSAVEAMRIADRARQRVEESRLLKTFQTASICDFSPFFRRVVFSKENWARYQAISGDSSDD